MAGRRQTDENHNNNTFTVFVIILLGLKSTTTSPPGTSDEADARRDRFGIIFRIHSNVVNVIGNAAHPPHDRRALTYWKPVTDIRSKAAIRKAKLSMIPGSLRAPQTP